MFKFLHAADIHLDSPLRGLDRYEGCPSDEIRGATRRALDNLVQLAIEEQVAFVLIAGDVYDGDWKDHNTGLWFVKRMAELRDAGIKVFLIRGNHDAQNRMTRDLRLPDNVDLARVDRPQTCHLDDVPVAIHGQGFASQAVTDDLAASYPARDPGCFNVGMLHTSVNGREGHDRYAPCTVESLRAKNYGYWALGHVHKREVLDERDGPIVFPGNIQGRHIREAGPKGCMLVTVEGHRVAVRGVPPARRPPVGDLPARRLGRGRMATTSAEPSRTPCPACLDEGRGAVLALRVEVVGESAAPTSAARRSGRLVAHEIRATAVDHGAGRVWVEEVKLRTRPACGSAKGTRSTARSRDRPAPRRTPGRRPAPASSSPAESWATCARSSRP